MYGGRNSVCEHVALFGPAGLVLLALRIRPKKEPAGPRFSPLDKELIVSTTGNRILIAGISPLVPFAFQPLGPKRLLADQLDLAPFGNSSKAVASIAVY